MPFIRGNTRSLPVLLRAPSSPRFRMLSESCAAWASIGGGESGVAHSEHAWIIFPSSSPAGGLLLFFSSRLLSCSRRVGWRFGVITRKKLRAFSRQRKLMCFYSELCCVTSNPVNIRSFANEAHKRQAALINLSYNCRDILSVESVRSVFSNGFWMWNLIFIAACYKWWLGRFLLPHLVRSCS